MDSVANEDMNSITSNAVYNLLQAQEVTLTAGVSGIDGISAWKIGNIFTFCGYLHTNSTITGTDEVILSGLPVPKYGNTGRTIIYCNDGSVASLDVDQQGNLKQF